MENVRVIELLKEIKLLMLGKNKTDRWLDLKQASKYCSLSPATLRRRVKSGKLKASNNLGKMLIKESELERMLNN